MWVYSEIECERPISPEAWLGSDGPLELYVGAERVISFAPRGGHCLGERRIRLPLRAGCSGFLLKVNRGRARFGFSFLVCDRPGILPMGVHYRIPSETRAEEAIAAAAEARGAESAAKG